MNELSLCGVSIGNVPLRDAIPAAAAAGFRVMSVTARSHRRCAMPDAELREVLAAHEMRVHDVEATFDWLGLAVADAPTWLQPEYSTDELLDVGEALGASTIAAVHFGEAAPLDVAAAAFARLCDRAAARGMKVALEYPAFATIDDLAGAWAVVDAADRPNAGLLVDLWHHRRSHSAEALLAAVPADRIFSVQLSDGAAAPEGSLLEDVHRRRLPGEGDFDVVGFVRGLLARGVSCPLGVEVFDPSGLQASVPGAMRALHDTLDQVVRAAAAV